MKARYRSLFSFARPSIQVLHSTPPIAKQQASPRYNLNALAHPGYAFCPPVARSPPGLSLSPPATIQSIIFFSPNALLFFSFSPTGSHSPLLTLFNQAAIRHNIKQYILVYCDSVDSSVSFSIISHHSLSSPHSPTPWPSDILSIPEGHGQHSVCHVGLYQPAFFSPHSIPTFKTLPTSLIHACPTICHVWLCVTHTWHFLPTHRFIRPMYGFI